MSSPQSLALSRFAGEVATQLVLHPLVLAVPVLFGCLLIAVPFRWALARKLNPLFDKKFRNHLWWIYVEPSFFPGLVRSATYARLVLNRGAIIPRTPQVLDYDFRGAVDAKTLALCRRFRRYELVGLGALLWVFLFGLAEGTASPWGRVAALAVFLSFWLLTRTLSQRLVPGLDPHLAGEFPHHRGVLDEPATKAERGRIYATWIFFPRFFARKHPAALRFDYKRAVPLPLRLAAKMYTSLFLGLLVLALVLGTYQAFHRISTQL